MLFEDNVDSSDPVECISWYHMSMKSWGILICLSRLGTIGQNEVEVNTCTIVIVVFKANECMKGTVLL